MLSDIFASARNEQTLHHKLKLNYGSIAKKVAFSVLDCQKGQLYWSFADKLSDKYSTLGESERRMSLVENVIFLTNFIVQPNFIDIGKLNKY